MPSKSLFRPYRTKRKKAFAKNLRKNPTRAELLLLRELRRDKNIAGYLRVKFQCIILGWIVDFYFPRSKIIVEVDGSVHDNPEHMKYDAHRGRILTAAGFKIIRFKNEKIFNDMDNVLHKIYWNVADRWGEGLMPWWLEEYTKIKL